MQRFGETKQSFAPFVHCKGGAYDIGFFKQDEISLVMDNSGHIHLSLSLTQGTEPVKGDGSLATFTISGIATGNTQITIDESELFFYDELGNSIVIEDLTIEPLDISFQRLF